MNEKASPGGQLEPTVSTPRCDLGNGEFDHDWEVVHDWEGDPGVIGGTQNIVFIRCRRCGEENYDVDPNDYRDDDEEWV